MGCFRSTCIRSFFYRKSLTRQPTPGGFEPIANISTLTKQRPPHPARPGPVALHVTHYATKLYDYLGESDKSDRSPFDYWPIILHNGTSVAFSIRE